MLYIISHDLKEPLRSVEYFTDALKERHSDNLDEKGIDFLSKVISSAERMHSLLDDILTLSRVRKIKKPEKLVSAREIIDDAVGMLDMKIKDTNTKLFISKDFPELCANKMWATQAIYNLIANAIKFSSSSGSIPQISLKPYTREDAGKALDGIIVSDSGPGIEEECEEKIFELFQRAVGRDIEGTGTGLAIVKAVAERHGGEAWAENKEDGGANFYLTFAKAEAN